MNPMPFTGLSFAEAAARLRSDGYNELPAAERRGVFRIAFEVLRQPMFALLVAGGVIDLVLGDRMEAMLLLIIALISVVITINQESWDVLQGFIALLILTGLLLSHVTFAVASISRRLTVARHSGPLATGSETLPFRKAALGRSCGMPGGGSHQPHRLGGHPIAICFGSGWANR